MQTIQSAKKIKALKIVFNHNEHDAFLKDLQEDFNSSSKALFLIIDFYNKFNSKLSTYINKHYC